MEPLGKMPVPGPVLILGKAAMAGCFLFGLFKSQLSDGLLYDSPLLQTAGIILAAAGLLIIILGFISLNSSLSVGLPEQETQLKTRGVLRVTRNPLYLGGFMACIGSCLYTLHPLNLLLCAVAIGIHHAIVTREEQFLAKRFGQEWVDYSHHVPRYLGRFGG